MIDRLKSKVAESKLAEMFQHKNAPFIGAAALVVLFAVILYSRYPGNFESYQNGPPGDFSVYLQAWNRYRAGESPYVPHEYSAYKYSPGILALIQFLPSSSVDAWFVFSLLCILGFAGALLFGARYRTWKDVGCLVLGLGLSWKGIIESFDYGQIETLILTIAIFSASLFARYTFWAGLLAGILPWLKLPWAFLFLPFVLAASRVSPTGEAKPPARRLKLLVSGYMMSSFIWGAAVPSLAFGPEKALELSQSWMTVLRQQPHSLFFSDINQSIWISSLRLMGEGKWLSYAVPSLFAAVLLGFLIRRRPQTPSTQDSMSWLTPWLVFTQIINPLSWRWGSTYLVGIPFATHRATLDPTSGGLVASNKRLTRISRAALWVCVLALWLLQLNPVVQTLGIHHWTELHSFGIVTLYWIVLLMLTF